MDIGADCQSRRDPLADCSTVLGTQLQHEEPAASGSAATAKWHYALVLEAPTAGPDLELVNASGVAWKQASVSGLVLSGHKRYWYPPPWLAVSWNRTRASLPLVHTCAVRAAATEVQRFVGCSCVLTSCRQLREGVLTVTSSLAARSWHCSIVYQHSC